MAVTFDDGPSDLTPKVLDILAAAGIRATFFVLGAEVRKRPGVFRGIVAGGHEIGLHGYTHTLEGFMGQIRRCERTLAAWDVSMARFVRFPGNASWRHVLGLWMRKYTTLMYSFDTHDSMRLDKKWRSPPPEYSAIKGGDIVLMHDDNSICVRELPDMLGAVRAKGLRALSVGDLFGRTGNSRSGLQNQAELP